MALRLREVVTVRSWAFLLALFSFTMFGCKGYMQDDNTFLVTFGTTLTFKSTGPKDVDRRGEVGIDFQDWAKKPLVDWVLDSDGDGEADMSADPDAAGPE